jgi:hypothetical protein
MGGDSPQDREQPQRPKAGLAITAVLISLEEHRRGAVLLRGGLDEEPSRELNTEAHRMAAWRDDFLAAGSQGLKGQAAGGPAGRLMIGRSAGRTQGWSALHENEVPRAATEEGCLRSAGEAAQIGMEHAFPVAVVPDLGAPSLHDGGSSPVRWAATPTRAGAVDQHGLHVAGGRCCSDRSTASRTH